MFAGLALEVAHVPLLKSRIFFSGVAVFFQFGACAGCQELVRKTESRPVSHQMTRGSTFAGGCGDMLNEAHRILTQNFCSLPRNVVFKSWVQT